VGLRHVPARGNHGTTRSRALSQLPYKYKYNTRQPVLHLAMDQFVLFGDSITQHSFSQEKGFAFGAELSDQYARKLDVIK
jgi:hypothetical protein